MFNQFSDLPEIPVPKDLTPAEREEVRVKTALYGCGAYILAILAVIVALALFHSCAVPKVIEQHHHHVYQTDTLAVQSAVDTRMQSWQAQSEDWFRQMLTQESAQWSSNEDQRETITETVTTATDSLGRSLRTEQRTINRAMVNSQWSMVNKVTQEYEQRLCSVVDSLDAAWHHRYDSLASSVLQTDSTAYTKTPAADVRPWYRRILDRAEWLALGVVIALVALLILAKKFKSH